jgi:hypothetical protein
VGCAESSPSLFFLFSSPRPDQLASNCSSEEVGSVTVSVGWRCVWRLAEYTHNKKAGRLGRYRTRIRVCNRDGGERCNHGLPWHSLGIPPDRAAASFKAQMQPHGNYNAHNRYLQWRSKQLEALWLYNGAIRCSTVGCDANFPGCESGACSRPSRQHLGGWYCIG